MMMMMMKKLFACLIFLVSAAAFAQDYDLRIPDYNTGAFYATRNTMVYFPSTWRTNGTMYMLAQPGVMTKVVQSAAGTGMTVGGPYTAVATTGGCSRYPSFSFNVLTATTIDTPKIIDPGVGCTTASGTFTVTPAIGGTRPSFVTSQTFTTPGASLPPVYASAYWIPLNGGLPYPNGIPFFTPGTNVTSAVCTSGYSCTNTRGNVTVTISGTAASGTIVTMAYGNFDGSDSFTLPTAPGGVQFSSSGTTPVQLAHGVPSTTGLSWSSGTSITASTVFAFDYNLIP